MKRKICQACGHQTTKADKSVKTTDGYNVHESHTTDPRSGLYGDRKPSIFRRA
ncbi:hypothetical protein [Streptomyces sp. NPDC056683]|uniref:hypothetical protein n=1 Tax=Streptomyces sp. NPDC056683 TaxID=3345910 RepID=UPI00369C9515